MKKVLVIAAALTIAELSFAQSEMVYYPGDSKRSTPEQYPEMVDDIFVLEEYAATPEEHIAKKKEKKEHRLTTVSGRFSGLADDDGRRIWYSGMVDVGFGNNVDIHEFSASVSTTHGLHFSKWFFMGLGVGYLYEKDGTYFPSYQIPDANYYYYEDWKGNMRGDWQDNTKTNRGHDIDCHSFNYFLDMRAYIAKCKWVIPYVDVKLGGITSIVWHEGSWAQRQFSDRDDYTGERVTKTIGYRAHPNKAAQTGFYYELGVGVVIARYLDVRFAFGSGNDMLAPVNLQCKIGARF